MTAAVDSTAFAGVEMMLTDRSSVRRQDFTVTTVNDSSARGTIRGTVIADGQPVSNARIATDGMPGVRSGEDGGFILRSVRAGTRQLFIQGIGFAPESRIVEVIAGDTAVVSVTVGKVTLLDSVRVTAATGRSRMLNQVARRRELGIGYHRDSTQLAKYATLEGVFISMPSVTVQRPRPGVMAISVGARCRSARIFVDNVASDADRLAGLRPDELAAIEVYRSGEIAADLATQLGMPPTAKPCVILAWTRRFTR